MPADKLWGAQTQRSLEYFNTGKDLVPREMITSELVATADRFLVALLGASPGALAILGFLAVAFAFALALDLPVMHRWLDEPVLELFPLIGVVACIILYVATRRRQSLVPSFCGLAIFAAAFATLAVSFYPYMVPFSITVADAVPPAESLSFTFWGAGTSSCPSR